jgi:hypothetical protein
MKNFIKEIKVEFGKIYDLKNKKKNKKRFREMNIL